MQINKAVLALFFVFINILIRLPGIYKSLPPNQFSDEVLITQYGYDTNYRALLRDTYHLTSGGMNFYLPAGIALVIEKLIGQPLDYYEYTFWARVFCVVFMNSLGVLFILMALARLKVSDSIFLLSGLVLTLSPFAQGVSRFMYPDHYVFFFPCLLFYLMTFFTEQAQFSTSKKFWAQVFFVGFVVGAAASVKYHAGLLILCPIIFFFQIYRKQMKQFAKIFSLLALGSMIAFIFFNGLELPYQWVRLKAGLEFNHHHYTAGHPGLESDNSLIFYLKMLLGMSFGVLGAGLFFLGLLNLKKWPLQLKSFFLGAIPILLILGSYRVALHRNLMVVLPAFLLVMAWGLNYLSQFSLFKKSSTYLALLVFVVSIEPMVRIGVSLDNDYKRSSKNVAREWILENHQASEGWGQSPFLIGNPTPESWKVETIDFMNPHLKCYNYFILNDWYYQTFGPGKNPLTHLVFSELIYLNPTQHMTSQLHEKIDSFLKQYNKIKEFSDVDYFGSNVSIYKRNETCPSAEKSLVLDN